MHASAARAAVMVVVLSLVGSCSDPSNGMGLDGSDSDAEASADDDPSWTSASAGGSGHGGGGDEETSVGSGGASEAGEPPPPVGTETGVRFVAFGDTGEGNEAQQMVANAAEVVCAERGCDFALLLGDNFYDAGVTSTMDQQFIDKFETIYEGLDLRFYVVLGNHDYGTLANDWARGDYQVEYTQFSDKWYLPHFWYTFESESKGTQFFAFDTARMMWGHDVDEQRLWLASELLTSTAPWKVAIAHHPYISNGKHGNAGNYEGLGWLPLLGGQEVEDVIEDLVCGRANVYISGHDHNRQAFDPVCGTYFLVSGASSKTEAFVFREDNPTRWGDDTREGFLWVEIEGDELTAAFYDLDGNLDHELTASL